MDLKRISDNQEFIEWCLDNQEAVETMKDISVDEFEAFLNLRETLIGGKAPRKQARQPQARQAKATQQPKAKPQTKQKSADGLQHFTCSACNKAWSRTPMRGKSPIICPECRESGVKPKPQKRQQKKAQLHVVPGDGSRGPWAKIGQPKSKKDWEEKVARAGLPPKLVTMLDNWGKKHGWKATERSEKQTKLSKTAANKARARRSRGDSAPKSSAAGN